MTTGSAADGSIPLSASVDERVLQVGTTLRFVLLLLLFVAGSAAMTSDLVALIADPGNNQVGCQLADGVNPAGGLYQSLASADYGDPAALSACLARHVPDVGWIPGAVTAGVIVAAYGLYRLLPTWIRARRRLIPLRHVDERGVVRSRVDELAAVAGLPPGRLRLLVNPSSATAGALVFGTRRHQELCLNAGLLVTSSTDPQRFRAVMLHELAHIRNGDLGVTYATVALWRVFLVAVLLPRAAALVYEMITNTAPAPWGNTASYANALAQLIIIVALVYLARADILRDREICADRTAARWEAGPDAWNGPKTEADGRRAQQLAKLRDLLSTHPSWTARARSLADPAALFAPSALLMFLTGAAADITSVQLLQGLGTVTWQQEEVQALVVAGLIAAIAGVALWRAATYAVIAGRPAPTGLGAGLWLGAGLGLGELTDVMVNDGRLLPGQPEALLILVAACLLFTVWTAQYAGMRIRTCRGRSLRPAMAAGLIAPWLLLTFVLYWWYSDGSGLATGWIYSTGGIARVLALSGIFLPAHPGPLLTFGLTILVLPGSDTSFAGLWWVLSLIWLVPLLLLAARPATGAPAWLRRAVAPAAVLAQGTTPGNPPIAGSVGGGVVLAPALLPRLRSALWPGLAGGLAATAGLLAVMAYLHLPGGIISLPQPGAAEVGYTTWAIIVPGGAAILTAAVVAAFGEQRYYLLRGLVAAGIAALSGFAAEYLLQTVDGCLGPFNVMTPACHWLPAAPWPDATNTLGYLLGPTIVLAGVAAILAGAIRQRRGRPVRLARPSRHTARVAGPRSRSRLVRVVAIAIIGLAAAGLISVDTVQSGLSSQGDGVPSAVATGIEKRPAAGQVQPQTARLQLRAWLQFGGRALADETASDETAFGNAVGALARASHQRAAWVFRTQIPPACARFNRLVDRARAYFPVPIPAGQRLWAHAVAEFRTTVLACRILMREPSTATVLATAKDSEKAIHLLVAFYQWVGRLSAT